MRQSDVRPSDLGRMIKKYIAGQRATRAARDKADHSMVELSDELLNKLREDIFETAEKAARDGVGIDGDPVTRGMKNRRDLERKEEKDLLEQIVKLSKQATSIKELVNKSPQKQDDNYVYDDGIIRRKDGKISRPLPNGGGGGGKGKGGDNGETPGKGTGAGKGEGGKGGNNDGGEFEQNDFVEKDAEAPPADDNGMIVPLPNNPNAPIGKSPVPLPPAQPISSPPAPEKSDNKPSTKSERPKPSPQPTATPNKKPELKLTYDVGPQGNKYIARNGDCKDNGICIQAGCAQIYDVKIIQAKCPNPIGFLELCDWQSLGLPDPNSAGTFDNGADCSSEIIDSNIQEPKNSLLPDSGGENQSNPNSGGGSPPPSNFSEGKDGGDLDGIKAPKAPTLKVADSDGGAEGEDEQIGNGPGAGPGIGGSLPWWSHDFDAFFGGTPAFNSMNEPEDPNAPKLTQEEFEKRRDAIIQKGIDDQNAVERLKKEIEIDNEVRKPGYTKTESDLLEYFNGDNNKSGITLKIDKTFDNETGAYRSTSYSAMDKNGNAIASGPAGPDNLDDELNYIFGMIETLKLTTGIDEPLKPTDPGYHYEPVKKANERRNKEINELLNSPPEMKDSPWTDWDLLNPDSFKTKEPKYGSPGASNKVNSILNDGMDILSGNLFDSTKSEPLANNSQPTTVVNNYNTMGGGTGGSGMSGENTMMSPGLFMMSNPETTAQRVSYDMAKAAIL